MRMSRSERTILRFLETRKGLQISYLEMALELGVTERTAIEAVSRLERRGRIQVERGRGRKANRYSSL